MKQAFLCCFFLLCISVNAQTNVRAWYADGQVWVVWEAASPLPETYAIYGKPSAFTNTANAALIGRLFREEYGPGALREQIDSTATYRIPDGQGGIYQLAASEALFVATPHQAGASWIAVVPWGETNVSPGVNITSSAVQFQYNPALDPIECHLQAVFPSPFAADFTCFAYYMWADGRQNEWENRPDFPVMANAAKNGMPSLFLVSAPTGLDTTGGIPATIWLHGGGGTARQSLAGSRAIVNLKPEQGILVAHNDDLFGYLFNTYPGFESVSRHFGWRKNYDPFSPNTIPITIDTIVNYTQRRYFWIDQWLIRTFHVDPRRININGHSMGSKGTTAMAKTFPDHYASATVFNSGFLDTMNVLSPLDVVFGPNILNFPTNLVDREGETVRFSTAFDITDRNAPKRDLPLFRCFDGKNDDNGEMHWAPYVVQQYRAADSLGWGMQLYWSERTHDIGGTGDHWAFGNGPTEQTAVEDVAYEENFHSDVSFPGFFNHRLDPQNNDPGDGTIGTGGNGVGDDWGTWGGWHRWDWDNIIDLPGGWSVVAWLENNAVFANDNCPVSHLIADLAIRKPKQFKPATGKLLHWSVKDDLTGNILQSGNAIVQADSLVVIPQVAVYNENIRRVRISVTDPTVATITPKGMGFSKMAISPNPSSGPAFLDFIAEKDAPVTLQLRGLNGNTFKISIPVFEGENHISLAVFNDLPAGLYMIELNANGYGQTMLKWVKF